LPKRRSPVARYVRLERGTFRAHAGGMSALWFEERSDTPVWHLAMAREAGTYRMACGWQFRVSEARIWPQKRDETGPIAEERCRACMLARPEHVP
jgi:hypothetical protein